MHKTSVSWGVCGLARFLATRWMPEGMGRSADFLAVGRLTGHQECLHQFAFAAGDHAGKALEPRAVRDFGIGVAPVAKQAHLIETDLALPNTKGKMLDESAWQLMSANSWHVMRRRRNL